MVIIGGTSVIVAVKDVYEEIFLNFSIKEINM